MRNKVLIAIAISLTLIVVVVRLQFHNNLELFKTNILAYEREQISILNKTKDEHLKSLKLKNPTILPLFDNQFTDANAIEERDTTFNYFYLNESVKYKSPKRDFVECLLYKCGLDYQNEITLKQIDKKVASLKYRYDETFSLWYPQFS